MNLFYKCVSFLPVKLIFVAMKEVVRVRKIAAGVHHAHHRYHHGWFIMMATGWVKGDTPDIGSAAGRSQPCGRGGGEVQGDHVPAAGWVVLWSAGCSQSGLLQHRYLVRLAEWLSVESASNFNRGTKNWRHCQIWGWYSGILDPFSCVLSGLASIFLGIFYQC